MQDAIGQAITNVREGCLPTYTEVRMRHIPDMKASREFNLVVEDIVTLCGLVSRQRSDGTRTHGLAWMWNNNMCSKCIKIEDQRMYAEEA